MKSINKLVLSSCLWAVFAIPVQLYADGNVVQVEPSNLACDKVIDFENLSSGSHEGLLVETGASFAERFAGQNISFAGDFDVLGSTADNSLALQTGPVGENLYILPYGGGNVLIGCGHTQWSGCTSIGEGSFGALFDAVQPEVGIKVVGGGGGGMTVNFLAADGSNIDTLVVQLPAGSTTVGFQRVGGVSDIAGISIHNNDSGGIGYDDITHCDVSELMIEVQIDIKFCGNPNAFNCKKKGVLPVTIFGADSFDVANIDPGTLRLCLEDLSVCTEGPRGWFIADRGDSDTDLGAAMCAVDPLTGLELDYLNRDGFTDLNITFEASQVQDMLGVFCSMDTNSTSGALIITGATFDGTPVYSVPIPSVGIDQLVKKNEVKQLEKTFKH